MPSNRCKSQKKSRQMTCSNLFEPQKWAFKNESRITHLVGENFMASHFNFHAQLKAFWILVSLDCHSFWLILFNEKSRKIKMIHELLNGQIFTLFVNFGKVQLCRHQKSCWHDWNRVRNVCLLCGLSRFPSKLVTEMRLQKYFCPIICEAFLTAKCVDNLQHCTFHAHTMRTILRR